MKYSEDVLDVIWTSCVRSIYVLSLGFSSYSIFDLKGIFEGNLEFAEIFTETQRKTQAVAQRYL